MGSEYVAWLSSQPETFSFEYLAEYSKYLEMILRSEYLALQEKERGGKGKRKQSKGEGKENGKRKGKEKRKGIGKGKEKGIGKGKG